MLTHFSRRPVEKTKKKNNCFKTIVRKKNVYDYYTRFDYDIILLFNIYYLHVNQKQTLIFPIYYKPDIDVYSYIIILLHEDRVCMIILCTITFFPVTVKRVANLATDE